MTDRRTAKHFREIQIPKRGELKRPMLSAQMYLRETGVPLGAGVIVALGEGICVGGGVGGRAAAALQTQQQPQQQTQNQRNHQIALTIRYLQVQQIHEPQVNAGHLRKRLRSRGRPARVFGAESKKLQSADEKVFRQKGKHTDDTRLHENERFCVALLPV